MQSDNINVTKEILFYFESAKLKKKTTSIVREAQASRHNGGLIKGPPFTSSVRH